MGPAIHPVSRFDIEACLGPVSEHLARRIMASGATVDELTLAVREVGLGKYHRQRGRVHELCQLLAEELGPELWPDY